MRRQSRKLKAEVIRELKQLAEGRPTEQQSLLERYMECPDWQLASKIIRDAVQASLRGRGRTRLASPPGWIQPL
jgi:hypothetical protein